MVWELEFLVSTEEILIYKWRLGGVDLIYKFHMGRRQYSCTSDSDLVEMKLFLPPAQHTSIGQVPEAANMNET